MRKIFLKKKCAPNILFRKISNIHIVIHRQTLQCGLTCRTLEAGIKTRLNLS